MNRFYRMGMDYGILFYLLIFITAVLYSSVGHGGATGYLAIMALFAVQPDTMRSSALILNLFVAGISFYSYLKGGYFRLRLLVPFVVFSVPMSFLGARMNIDPYLYRIILGVFLLVAVARMLFTLKSAGGQTNINIPLAFIVGSLIGFFSGFIGIGGGIILSPVLLLLKWADVKEAAAVSALFILMNSASGIAGLASGGGLRAMDEIYLLIALGIAGSITGSYLGRDKLSSVRLTYLLASVLLIASVKLFYF